MAPSEHADEYDETDEDREFMYRHTDSRFFLESLEGDVQRCEALCAAAPSDNFARRTLVRTVFAEVEGLCASAIDWARYYAGEKSVLKDRYTEAERVALRGLVAQVDDGGVARLVPETKYRPTKVTLKFALSLVGRGAATLPAIEFGDGGWSALVEGFGVRDRLMHPKVADNLLVTDEDLLTVRRGRTWFVTTYKALDRAYQNTVAADVAQTFGEWMRKESNVDG